MQFISRIREISSFSINRESCGSHYISGGIGWAEVGNGQSIVYADNLINGTLIPVSSGVQTAALQFVNLMVIIRMKRGSVAAQRNPDKPKGNKERIVNASVENVGNNTRAGPEQRAFPFALIVQIIPVEYEIHLVGNTDIPPASVESHHSVFHSRSCDRATRKGRREVKKYLCLRESLASL